MTSPDGTRGATVKSDEATGRASPYPRLSIMSTGMTVCLIAGRLDVSLRSIFALIPVVTGQLLLAGAPRPVLILGGLLAGVL